MSSTPIEVKFGGLNLMNFQKTNNAYRTIQTIKIGPLNVDNQLFEFWMIYLMGMDQTALIMCFD